MHVAAGRILLLRRIQQARIWRVFSEPESTGCGAGLRRGATIVLAHSRRNTASCCADMGLISTSGMSGIETLNRAFSAALVDDRIPGASPQASDEAAPLAQCNSW